MKKIFVLTIALFMSGWSVYAQCPPSSESGYHVVQQDETLYKISLMYRVSLNSLLAMNNMRETDILKVCQRLRVGEGGVPPSTQNMTPSNSNSMANTVNNGSFNRGQKQAGERHVVQPGETTAQLARLYGYTEERFREFNAMGNDRLTAGSIVLSHDCACDRVTFSENATPINRQTITEPSKDIASEYRPETTTYYDQKTPTRINQHDPISPSETSTVNNNNTTSTTNTPASAAPYMSSIEMSMVNEINMLRANPPAYSKYIDEYVRIQQTTGGFPVDMSVVAELKAQLRSTAPLSQLKTAECIYMAAKNHGQDLIRMGDTNHTGSDGRAPWDRVKDSCPGFKDGNENLVGGPDNIREAVVILLLDEGIPSRGHRTTLLRADWDHVACYKIGNVGQMPNCWVQKFGASGQRTSSVGSGSASNNTNTNSDDGDGSAFMKSAEVDMLNEINMLRANPSGYAKYIDEYVAEQKATGGFPIDMAAVAELKSELRRTRTLSQLKPKRCIYAAAKKHGKDIIKMGNTNHVGSDGKWPWDRVRRECPEMTDGKENLVGGPDNIREAVVILLIDDGIPSRGHRKVLLQPEWEYAACYRIGDVGMMPNCWVQKFGY